jgi:hypothetical protein
MAENGTDDLLLGIKLWLYPIYCFFAVGGTRSFSRRYIAAIP